MDANLDKIKELLGSELLRGMSEEEVEKLIHAMSSFADFAYKDWINSRKKAKISI
jgi:hypothetical protein